MSFTTLLDKDYAYFIDIFGMRWLCGRARHMTVDCGIVHYRAAAEYLHHPDDFVLWCESTRGAVDKIGKGLKTINMINWEAQKI